MVGMARKKLNSAAARLSTPSSTPPTMVAPERDTPGIIDTHCISPTPSAVFSGSFMASSCRGAGLQRSSASRPKPPISSDQQMISGLANSTVLMKS